MQFRFDKSTQAYYDGNYIAYIGYTDQIEWNDPISTEN